MRLLSDCAKVPGAVPVGWRPCAQSAAVWHAGRGTVLCLTACCCCCCQPWLWSGATAEVLDRSRKHWRLLSSGAVARAQKRNMAWDLSPAKCS